MDMSKKMAEYSGVNLSKTPQRQQDNQKLVLLSVFLSPKLEQSLRLIVIKPNSFLFLSFWSSDEIKNLASETKLFVTFNMDKL